MEGTGSGFFRFQNRISSTWSVNENNVSADQEVDLTLRLGLDLPEEDQEAPAQGVSVSNNIKIPTLHQGMGNGEILENAGEGLERKLDHKPWPLPVLNMLRNNWNNISGNPVIQQQQQPQKRCTTCQKTDTPLWRKGPDGPRTLCNGCGLRYARESKRT